MVTPNYFHTALAGSGSANRGTLTQRWSGKDVADLRARLTAGAPLPDHLSTVEVTFAGRAKRFVDLRGLNLSKLALNDVDLSFCALDFADFDECVLSGVHLQYSRLVSTTFRGAKLLRAQASPIDARNSDFSEATISGGYFMGSSFAYANTSNASFSGARLEGVEGLSQLQSERGNDAESAKRVSSDFTVIDVVEMNRVLAERLSVKKFHAVYKKNVCVGRIVDYDSERSCLDVLVERPWKEKSGGSLIYKSHIYKSIATIPLFELGDKVEIVKTADVNSGSRKRFSPKAKQHSQAHVTTTTNWIVRKLVARSGDA